VLEPAAMAEDETQGGAPRRPGGTALVLAAVVVLAAVAAWRFVETRRRLSGVVEAAPVGPPAAPRPAATALPYGRIVPTSPAPAAPPLDLATADGKRFSLAAARGQVVFVNFWATWCPPCAKEMPSMVRLGAELERAHPGKFRMVTVSVDESLDQVRAFFARPDQGGRLPPGVVVAHDPDAAVTRAFYCTGRGACAEGDVKFPESYVVDKAGRIVAYVVGDRDWSDDEARTYLTLLIQG